MNEEIENILSQLIIDNEPIPFSFVSYNGKSNTYITYHEISKEPIYADDYPFLIIYTFDFDIYSKKNYFEIEEKLRKLLLNNDWVWLEDAEDVYDKDTSFFHKTLTFRKEKAYG